MQLLDMKFTLLWMKQFNQQVELLKQGGKAAFVHRPGRLLIS